jgi:uncharacterized membrane protein YphA (DoxX/SURF4 family)
MTDEMRADPRQYVLALVRIVIGWHFLYEGLVKLLYPGWTSAAYLNSSVGPFAGFFHVLGSNGAAVRVIDLLNIWGLLVIGACLMLGAAARAAAFGGMALLALYYFAYPPLFKAIAPGINEGSYLLVNKNVVEWCALAVVAAFPAEAFGLHALLRRRTSPAARAAATRRELVSAMIGLPVLGAFVLAVLRKHGWRSFEELQLRGRGKGDSFVASATVKSFQFASMKELSGRLPRAGIGNVTLSRMILGGNLMGGWAHSRDLIYVSKLVKAYHHRDKIFETLALAEACGVNAILTNPALTGVINEYWRNGGKIQFISDCGGGKDILQSIRQSIDRGACACYFHGGIADGLVERGNFDVIAKGLDLIRKHGLPAGIGGHKLATIRGCVDRGLRPDFWMKTFHRVDYWSARQPDTWVGSAWSKPDNIWCESPEAVADYMNELPEPWMAFKILAAGAMHPKVAFREAFEAGADFIVVGMYDFQIIEDVNLAASVLQGPLSRKRDWRA